LKALKRLAEDEKVQIHISDITRREFETNLQSEFDAAIAGTRKSIKKLKDICPGVTECNELQGKVEAIEAHRDEVSDEFENWLAEAKAHVHPVTGEHGLAVVDSYFDGSPPFAQIKSRKNFPDAFVYRAILDLKEKASPLYVITNDSNLAEYVAKLENVTAISSVDEFVKAPQVSKLIQRTENLAQFVKFATAADGAASRVTITNAIEEQLPGHSVGGFPEDYEAIIDGYGEIRDLELKGDSIDDYGEGIFSIPFTAYSECLVGFCIPKWVYFGMDGKHKPRSIEDWNDHVFRADKEYDLRIEGRISFETEPGALDSTIRKIKDWAQIFQSLDVQVEIDSVEIVDEEIREAFYS
jgi:hypothetical protein